MVEPNCALRVAVVGQFSSGKSALINALLGEEVAPMGVTPVTAVLHRFCWADARSAVIERHDGTTDEVSPSVLTSQPLTEAQLLGVREVRVNLPIGVLRDIEVWDTPGFGSNALSHELVARRALIDADIVVWVTPLDHAINRAEAEKMERLRHEDTPVLLVVNKADIEDDPEERAEAVADITTEVGGLAHAVVLVSALLELRALRAGDDSTRLRSGFEELEQSLAELASEALKARRDATARRAARAVGVNEVRCPDCKTACRFDDKFCDCGASLEGQHRFCPRCETNNTIHRKRCRGCNLVFEAWDMALELRNRAEQESRIGLLVDAAATLALAHEALPDDKELALRGGELIEIHQKTSALIRTASRAHRGELWCSEMRRAQILFQEIGAGTGPFMQRVEEVGLDWATRQRERPEQAKLVLDWMLEAGITAPCVLDAHIQCTKEVERERRERLEERRMQLNKIKGAEQQLENARKMRVQLAWERALTLIAENLEYSPADARERVEQAERNLLRAEQKREDATVALHVSERELAESRTDSGLAAWLSSLLPERSAARRKALYLAVKEAQTDAQLVTESVQAARSRVEKERLREVEYTAAAADRWATVNSLLRPHYGELSSTQIDYLKGRVPLSISKRISAHFGGQGGEIASVLFSLTAIEPCTFMMGADVTDSAAFSSEHPCHERAITQAFQIGVVPVSQALWEAVMESNPSMFRGHDDSPQRPVEQVSWFDAVRFCNELSKFCGLEEAYSVADGERPQVEPIVASSGFRLPTEAEWECAARAGVPFRFSGSERAAEVAWYIENSGRQTHPVGCKRANAWGLFDMSGNVGEWTEDWYHPSFEDAPRDGSARMVGEGSTKVRRGGSWSSSATVVRITYRIGCEPTYRDAVLGFRLARTVP